MIFKKRDFVSLEDVTILVKTFQRPQTVNQAIKRIRLFYPSIKIFVADDSQHPTEIRDSNTQVFRLPFDSGLSAGRNLLLSKLETPYFLLMDDDNSFNRLTKLERMLEILQKNTLDILSCLIFERSLRKKELYRKLLKDYCMNFELNEGVLKFQAIYHQELEDCTLCDIVGNFFIARTESVRQMGGWDQRLKVGEHEDFFIRAKDANLRVGFTKNCKVDHVIIRHERFSPDYAAFRCRMPEFRKIWLAKHSIQVVQEPDGTTYSKDEYIQRSKW